MNNMVGSRTIRPLDLLLFSFTGTFTNLILLSLTLSVVLKLFGIHNSHFILIASLITSALVTFTQGSKGGGMIQLNPILGGAIASLPLNALFITSLFKARSDVVYASTILVSIMGNLTAAIIGFMYGRRIHANLDSPKYLLFFMLSINMGFVLVPITLVCWVAAILLLRYGLGIV